jgi:hypothetical protein
MRSINETRMVHETYIMERIAPVSSRKRTPARSQKFMDDMRIHAAKATSTNHRLRPRDAHVSLRTLRQPLHGRYPRNLRDRIITVGYKIVARREGRMATTIGEHEAILQALERATTRACRRSSMRTPPHERLEPYINDGERPTPYWLRSSPQFHKNAGRSFPRIIS